MTPRILRLYNRRNKTQHDLAEVLASKYVSHKIIDFLFELALAGKLKVKGNKTKEFIKVFKKFKEDYDLDVIESDRFYDEIFHKLYARNMLDKKNEGIKKAMNGFKAAYFMMKRVFRDKTREGKDENGKNIRYFEHLKETAKIIVNELPNPNMDKIIMALLHDSMEDIKGFSFDVISAIFGEKIARGVMALSKKDYHIYIGDDEKEAFNNSKGQERENWEKKLKQKRNKDYFGHMGELDGDILDVKFADRIHNLRDDTGCTRDKIIRKIIETRKYFIDIAKQRNLVAHNLIQTEIYKLIEKYNIKEQELNYFS